jgi:hypothetical protein
MQKIGAHVFINIALPARERRKRHAKALAAASPLSTPGGISATTPEIAAGTGGMKVEVLEDEVLLFEADFDFLPRAGESIARDSGGFLTYYDVSAVSHSKEQLWCPCAQLAEPPL